MLKSILIITISVFNLNSVETAYRDFLDHSTVERGIVSESLSEAWGASAMTGHEYILMQPSSEAEVYLRFVEAEPVEGYAPMTTYGWNATELLVKDPDAATERLRDSPFEIIGEPKDLWNAPNAPRAMQALGPGNEVLYLTRNGNFDTRSEIDRVFIMVLAGPSMTTLSDYYRQNFGLDVGEATPFAITVISKAQGLPADTTYPLAVATVSDDFLIELDEYPSAATPRPVQPGHLPPGVSMVTFVVADIGEPDIEWRSDPRSIKAFPYNGRKVGVTVGPAGEWIELVDAAQD
jgi:hypothetical protein